MDRLEQEVQNELLPQAVVMPMHGLTAAMLPPPLLMPICLMNSIVFVHPAADDDGVCLQARWLHSDMPSEHAPLQP